jgi:hypothetical protein
MQLAVLALLVLTEIVGMVAVTLGHGHLGGSLIGVGIVASGPYALWMRKTAL